MPEKTVKPITNQTVSVSQVPEVAEKADFEASGDVSQTQDEKVATYISENWDRQTTLRDGGYRKYTITGRVSEDPVFMEVSRILGVTGQSHTYLNELAEIAQMAATWTQNDTNEILGGFLRQVLRRTQFNSDSAESKITNLKRKLQQMFEKQKGKK